MEPKKKTASTQVRPGTNSKGPDKNTKPNLDQFITGEKKKWVSYMEGAKYYSLNYYTFVTLARKAGANIKIKKKAVVDLDLLEAYLEKNCKGDEGDV